MFKIRKPAPESKDVPADADHQHTIHETQRGKKKSSENLALSDSPPGTHQAGTKAGGVQSSNLRTTAWYTRTPSSRDITGRRPAVPTRKRHLSHPLNLQQHWDVWSEPGGIVSTISDLVRKKRNGERLTEDEIKQFIQGVVDGTMHEGQIGAMLMAIYLRGMSNDEVFCLTDAMTRTGIVLEWPEEWRSYVVDKQSTGGIGDKISLVLAPALAACGLKVPMITTRGLAITGGTLDKLESIPGIRVECSPEEIKSYLGSVGCCIVGQTTELVPADRILYRLRDYTATVESSPLVISSIISKKAAEGLAALALDVKYGSGALMKTKEDARHLAYAMVNMGYKMGIRTSAVLSAMNAPIGRMIGNALEVCEAIECLRGQVKPDLNELVLKLGGELLHLLSATSRKEGSLFMSSIISDGAALRKFKEMIIAQGVAPDVAEKLCFHPDEMWSILPRAKHITSLQCHLTGFVHHIDALSLGKVARLLGAGRTSPDETINYAVGLELVIYLGAAVYKGQDWIKVHHDTETVPEDYTRFLQRALVIKPVEYIPNIARITEIITQY